MNLYNSSFLSHFTLLASLCLVVLLPSLAQSQFVENTKGQIIKEEPFFNPEALKRKRIKSIEITFFEKKELRGINQIKGKVKHYLFDEEGRIARYYYTNNNYSTKKDTMVEWRYYKNNKLTTIKKGNNKNIKVQSIFYEDNKPSIYIHGSSYNISNNLTTIKINSYQEKRAEYINYSTLPNGDEVTEWCQTDKTVFEKLVTSRKDSSTYKETHSFPTKDNEFISYEYTYKDNLLTKMVEEYSQYPDYYYHFYYDSNLRLVGYSKYSAKWRSEIEVTELLYAEGTGNLQAVLSKNKINNSIKIKKFNYTYF